jgi:hypothetical protein
MSHNEPADVGVAEGAEPPRPLTPIRSVSELVEVLGGPTAVGRIVGRKPAAVCQWRAATIPPEHYLVVREACKERGFYVPTTLFGFEALRPAM